jgi:hypothetical protein
VSLSEACPTYHTPLCTDLTGGRRQSIGSPSKDVYGLGTSGARLGVWIVVLGLESLGTCRACLRGMSCEVVGVDAGNEDGGVVFNRHLASFNPSYHCALPSPCLLQCMP